MGIRMLHRRKAPARVHAAATADTQAGPGAAPRTRARPALALAATTSRVPGTPVTALRKAAARLRRSALTRFLAGFVPRDDSRLRLWAGAVRDHLAEARDALGRLLRPRTARRVPLFVVTANSLTGRPDGSAAR
ncbi:hypothetical protein [Streptomyces sp. NPDC005859]|uniref:hypothetical protein n=1 Tax=Streptomyces sp. NPDC005859 TaxID=3157170 RepID=UPI0033C5778F